MKSKLKVKELNDGDKVYFDWYDKEAPLNQSLGRAEFIICQIYKYGRLKKFFIYPIQQKNVDFYYVVNCDSVSFSAQSWTHKGLKEPKVWLSFYCKEHKAFSLRLYVPEDSKSFTVSTLTTAGINFDID